jgi:hypothetical protein
MPLILKAMTAALVSTKATTLALASAHSGARSVTLGHVVRHIDKKTDAVAYCIHNSRPVTWRLVLPVTPATGFLIAFGISLKKPSGKVIV